MQGYPEIRYNYIEGGVDKFTVLGGSWEEAFKNIKNDDSQMKRLRETLDKDLAIYLKKFEVKTKRDELWFMLDDTLKLIKDSLEYKEENPIFKKYNSVRSRIVNNLKLYSENNPPDENNRLKATKIEQAPIENKTPEHRGEQDEVPSPNEEKFINMVNTTFRNTKDGVLSPGMINMLNRNQKNYGLSDERAAQIIKELREKQFGSPENGRISGNLRGIF